MRGGTCNEPLKSCGCDNGAESSINSVGLKAASKSKSPRGAPAECEPTLVCEGYRYEVFRTPHDNDRNDDQELGALIENFKECYDPLIEILSQAPQSNMRQQAKFQACCRLKKQLKDFVARYPGTDCEIRREIDCLVCPQPSLGSDAFEQAMDEVGQQAFILLYKLLISCLCYAVLPPCPEPTHETRVPLATITVSCGTCRVIRVCNWTTLRKFVTTFPNLQYWLSWLPYGRQLRQYLEYLCCDLAGLRDKLTVCQPRDREEPNSPVGVVVRPRTTEAQAAPVQNFSNMTFSAFARDSDAYTLDALMSGLSANPDAKGAEFLTQVEQENPSQFLFLNFLAQPLFGSALGKLSTEEFEGRNIMSSIASALSTSPESFDRDDLKDLKKEVASLRTRVSTQEKEIETLRASMPKG